MPEPLDKTDLRIAQKLAEITPPAGLRARLLAGAPKEIVEATTPNWWAGGVTALAAAWVIALVIFGSWPRGGDSMSAATADITTLLSEGFDFDAKPKDFQKLRAWLAAHHPSNAISLPQGLATNQLLGCRELVWRGHRGSMACFTLRDGGEAHLVMFPSSSFSSNPGSTPRIASAGPWTRAAWSYDGMTYMLFVPAGMDPVKEFLSQAGNQRAGKIASSSVRSTVWPAASVSPGVDRISSRLRT